MKDLLLSQYKPVSELVTEKHEILKPKYPVIDFHTHYFNTENERRDPCTPAKVVDYLHANGVAGVVNLVCAADENMYTRLEFTKDYTHTFVSFGTVVDVTRIDEPDFAHYAAANIRKAFEKGIKGLKFLKDLSLVCKDKYGKYIRVDDERLRPIWKTAGELNIPVLIHIADPVAFFKPADAQNERLEDLIAFPHWSFCDSEFFTFRQLMEMQENLLTDNPDTTFVIAHVGSYSENLEHVSRQLEAHPNMYIDTAARINELGRQPYSARKFIIKYQDRILFGTDSSIGYTSLFPYYYRFLETYDEYFKSEPSQPASQWKIYGIGLPDEVLRKLYYENAVKLVPDFAGIIENSIQSNR